MSEAIISAPLSEYRVKQIDTSIVTKTVIKIGADTVFGMTMARNSAAIANSKPYLCNSCIFAPKSIPASVDAFHVK